MNILTASKKRISFLDLGVLKNVAIAPVVMLLGCATIQPVTGNGRFLQLSQDGSVYAQGDIVSSENCRRYADAMNTNPDVKITCSAESLEASLPYSYISTDAVTGEESVFRTKTLKFCELVREDAEKDKPKTDKNSACR